MFFAGRRLLKRKQSNEKETSKGSKTYIQKFNEIDFQQNQKQVCFEIQKLLSELSKDFSLTKSLEQELRSIQAECQLMIYSDVWAEDKVEELKNKTLLLLRKIEK